MLKFLSLSRAIGAEILGLDARNPIGSVEAKMLRQALDKYQLLIIRKQVGLSNDQHIAFVNVFGQVADEHLDGEHIAWVSNKKERKVAVVGEQKLRFHSDFTWTPWPLPYISLFAQELVGEVAPTQFASARRAWQALTPELQEELAQWRGHHRSNFSENAEYGNAEYCRQKHAEDPEAILYPCTNHPVRFSHPRTEDPLLFVSEQMTTEIEKVSKREESSNVEEASTLQACFAALYDPDFLYHHRWQEGDLIIWDNIALQHGRKAFAPLPGAAAPIRRLRRVVVSENYEDILNFSPPLRAAMTKHSVS
jgi:taurine dioxygenase